MLSLREGREGGREGGREEGRGTVTFTSTLSHM